MKYLLLLLFIPLSNIVIGQGITGTVKGRVIDELSEETIPGAKIIILDTEPVKGAIADFNGEFRIEGIPSGRHNIRITAIGYKPVDMQNVEVLTKELDFTIKMIGLVKEIEEVVVTGSKNEDLINNMVTNSARSFTIEESQRYAGSLGDVARMAQNFAGVQGADDSRNDIIVRGNSPTGVLYRLEGIDIPNPNHFSNFGTTGGPISMINANMLQKSDFLTGAFPAEYGNALAGVFDLHFRNGNKDKFEFLAQLGFNGFEGMAEGPFSKKHNASFVINYRYSALGLLSAMGVNFGTSSIPKYQDMTFKLNFPHKNGVTSIFGLGGISKVDLLASATEDDLYSTGGANTYFSGQTGFVGINHKQRINSNSFVVVNLGIQAATNILQNDTLDLQLENPFTNYRKNAMHGKQTTSISYVNKINTRHYIKAGCFADLIFFRLQDSIWRNEYQQFVNLHNTNDQTWLIRPYLSYQYKASDNVTLTAGLSYQYLALNSSWNLEPRLGMMWSVNKSNKLSLSYGYHSQMQPLEVYFRELAVSADETIQTNRDLDFTRSHHLVVGYDTYFKYGLHLKLEVYGQEINNAPVEAKSSAYSILNYGADFYSSVPDSLVNKGTGRNAGIELTFEKRMVNGFYFMLNGSLFQSTYKGSDRVEHSTGFNGNHTTNALLGYEFRFNEKKEVKENGKPKTIIALALDVKFVWNGGGRYTPVLIDESVLAGEEIRDLTRVNEEQYPDYYKLNTRLSLKFIRKKVTQEIAFDLQNVTNKRNIFYQAFDPNTGGMRTVYQTGFLPLAQFRVIF